jgi:hypothetical protein
MEKGATTSSASPEFTFDVESGCGRGMAGGGWRARGQETSLKPDGGFREVFLF